MCIGVLCECHAVVLPPCGSLQHGGTYISVLIFLQSLHLLVSHLSGLSEWMDAFFDSVREKASERMKFITVTWKMLMERTMNLCPLLSGQTRKVTTRKNVM